VIDWRRLRSASSTTRSTTTRVLAWTWLCRAKSTTRAFHCRLWTTSVGYVTDGTSTRINDCILPTQVHTRQHLGDNYFQPIIRISSFVIFISRLSPLNVHRPKFCQIVFVFTYNQRPRLSSMQVRQRFVATVLQMVYFAYNHILTGTWKSQVVLYRYFLSVWSSLLTAYHGRLSFGN